MANRAQRRRSGDRSSAGGRTTPRAPKIVPDGKVGISVDKVDEGVCFTAHLGQASFTAVWTFRDAVAIGEMLSKAGTEGIVTGKEPKLEERQSGIVVARDMPKT